MGEMYVILKYMWNFLEYCVKNYIFKVSCPGFGELSLRKKFSVLTSDCPYVNIAPLCPTLAPASLVYTYF
jgi:hypothetical protein